jgi:hypothetical protein
MQMQSCLCKVAAASSDRAAVGVVWAVAGLELVPGCRSSADGVDEIGVCVVDVVKE